MGTSRGLHGADRFGALVLLPFAYMISTSFKTKGEVFKTPIEWIPASFQWHNFSDAIHQHPIGHCFLNSLFVAVCVTLLNLLTCSLAGYSFAKFDYPGRNLVFGIVLATMMIPLASMIIPLFIVVKSLGWVDSYCGLILPAGTSAFGIFLMRQQMSAIPDDLLDAARLDGAASRASFFGSSCRYSKTALSSLAIFIFMWNWDSVFLAAAGGDGREVPHAAARHRALRKLLRHQLSATHGGRLPGDAAGADRLPGAAAQLHRGADDVRVSRASFEQ